MKLTRDRLKKIIKEELSEMMSGNEPQLDVGAIERQLQAQLKAAKQTILDIEMELRSASDEEKEELSDKLAAALQDLEYDKKAASDQLSAAKQGKAAFDAALMKIPPGKSV